MVLARPGDELGDGGGADPAAGRADRAAERLRVDRVLDQGQVGECVADLGALVQAERAEHPVRDAHVRERALQWFCRVPGAGDREDLAGWGAAGERVGDLGCDPVRLGVFVRERPDPQSAAGAAHRDQRLRGSSLVVRHAACGGVEDLGARAEVPPEHDLPFVRVAIGEAEQVSWVGVPPAVDQLVVIAAHAQVAVRAGEQVDQRRLRVAGVLELVGQDPPPSLPQPDEPVRMLDEQPHRAREQVVEVERVAAPQLALALAPHRGDQRAPPDVAQSSRTRPRSAASSSRGRFRQAPRRSRAGRSRPVPAGSPLARRRRGASRSRGACPPGRRSCSARCARTRPACSRSSRAHTE